MFGDQRGQASIEWIALVLLAACALAGLLAFVPAMDGRPLGAALARVFVCAVRRDCGAEHAALAGAYGESDARLVRSAAPGIVYEPGTFTLPIDYRRCRSHRCSDAPDDRGLDVSRAKRGGAPATAFTHVVRKGGRTYIQYWFYYPDSTTTLGGAAAAWRAVVNGVARGGDSYPGAHLDDWEGYQVRIDPSGGALARATAHHGYDYCRGSALGCPRHDWGPLTGWTRVSRGSHAGHIPVVQELLPPRVRAVREGVEVHERITTAPELRLVPLEPIDPRSYRSLEPDGPSPPWAKLVYGDPASDSTD
jgi:hypothetical protein